ncbi:MAG: hypothetical protein E7265_06235 [Lachnospiraceae bacterium]|nr:hypothetical protein [Lachnospiraceae bacterium]
MNIMESNAVNMSQKVTPDDGSGTKASVIGNVGDVIEGKVRKVSDRVSIDFNGREYSFSKTTVQNAKEGSSIYFQIKDVSDDRIVLKALGSSDDVTISESYEDVSTNGKSSATEGETQNNSSESISEQSYSNINNMTEKDIEGVDSYCKENLSDIEEFRLEAFDRLIDAIKTGRLFESAVVTGYQEKVQLVMESIKRAQLKNSIPQGMSKALAEYFVKYDIPVTEEKLEQIGVALKVTECITGPDDKAICYMLLSGLPMSATNLYNAMHMGTKVNSPETCETLYEDMKLQIKGIVTTAGYDWNNEMQERTKWLLANNIPITEDNLAKQDILLNIRNQGLDNDVVADTMLSALEEGVNPSEKPLVSQGPDIRKSVYDYHTVSYEAIDRVVAEGKLLNLNSLREADRLIRNDKESTESEPGMIFSSVSVRKELSIDIEVVTARRQLEEIRLKMTLQGARALAGRGINIDTALLQEVVDELRNIEKENIVTGLIENGIEPDTEQVEIIEASMTCRMTIAAAPAYSIGLMNAADEQGKGNLVSYAATATKETEIMLRAGRAYEAVMTTPRSDMGDSIQKAFASNIDDILRESGLNVTEANQRIVKILAHNQMEITTESIMELRDYDAKMQYMLNGLKPETVFEIIRSGRNPLEMSLDELNLVIHELNSNMDNEKRDEGESSYSRFLWKLEKESRISEEERESYIGICRLIRHVSKNDTAAVGAVVNAGMELNLKNLLQVVRSRRDSGMDEVIDDDYQMREAIPNDSNIDKQVASAYSYGYNESLATRVNSLITPSALYDITEGNINNIFEMSLEELADKLKDSSYSEIDGEYYKQITEEALKEIDDSNVMKVLRAFDLEPTVFNIGAVSQMTVSGQNVLAKLLAEGKSVNTGSRTKFRDSGSQENTPISEGGDNNKLSFAGELQNFEEAVGGLLDAMTDDASMQAQSDKVTMAARRLIEAGEQGVLSNENLKELRMLSSGIRVNRLMADRRSYEIPIVTKEGITSINLTLVKNSENSKGNVTIRMETTEFGNISLDFYGKNKKIQAVVLTENQGNNVEKLYDGVKEAIKQSGFEMVSFNHGIHNVRGMYIPDNGNVGQFDTINTEDMYKLAKNVILNITGM